MPAALLVARLFMVHGATGSLPGAWDFDIAGGCCAVVSDARMIASPMHHPSWNEGMHRVPSSRYSALFNHAIFALHLYPENPVVHGHSHQWLPRLTLSIIVLIF